MTRLKKALKQDLVIVTVMSPVDSFWRSYSSIFFSRVTIVVLLLFA